MLKVVLEIRTIIQRIAGVRKPPLSIFKKLSIANVFFTLQGSLPVYASSLYLAQFMSPSRVGLVFMASAAITLAVFPLVSRVLRRLGNYRLTLYAATLLLGALLGIALANSLAVALVCFVISYVLSYVIVFSLDLFLEQYTDDERVTGSTRAFYMSAGVAASIIASLLAGMLLVDFEYWKVFVAAAAVVIPFTILIGTSTRSFIDAPYSPFEINSTINCILRNTDVRLITILHFILRITFSWNAIVIPLYLIDQLGMNWTEFGTIMAIALSAYLFVFYPAGKLADERLGEKELLVTGFLIMSLALITLPLLSKTTLILWAVLLFVYRIGAALVEGMTESYFFKHVNASDPNTITVFRMTGPLGYIVGPGIATLLLSTTSFLATFLVFGLTMAIAAVAALWLKDTK